MNVHLAYDDVMILGDYRIFHVLLQISKLVQSDLSQIFG